MMPRQKSTLHDFSLLFGKLIKDPKNKNTLNKITCMLFSVDDRDFLEISTYLDNLKKPQRETVRRPYDLKALIKGCPTTNALQCLESFIEQKKDKFRKKVLEYMSELNEEYTNETENEFLVNTGDGKKIIDKTAIEKINENALLATMTHGNINSTSAKIVYLTNKIQIPATLGSEILQKLDTKKLASQSPALGSIKVTCQENKKAEIERLQNKTEAPKKNVISIKTDLQDKERNFSEQNGVTSCVIGFREALKYACNKQELKIGNDKYQTVTPFALLEESRLPTAQAFCEFIRRLFTPGQSVRGCFGLYQPPASQIAKEIKTLKKLAKHS